MTEPDQSRLVKAPQTRRGRGISAVYLESAADWGAGSGHVYVKRQESYYCHPAWRLFRRTPTLRRELRGLQACRRLGVPVPRVVSYRDDGSRAELVLEEICPALPLDRALVNPGADRATIVREVAGVIGRLHRGGWTHGALYPEHILVGPAPKHTVALIDLEKARHSKRRRQDDLERFWRDAPPFSEAEAALFRRCYRSALAGNDPCNR